jgi:hypothetical protein
MEAHSKDANRVTGRHNHKFMDFGGYCDYKQASLTGFALVGQFQKGQRVAAIWRCR